MQRDNTNADYFISTSGTVRLRVKEAIDVMDTVDKALGKTNRFEKKNNKKSSKHWVYAGIEVVRELICFKRCFTFRKPYVNGGSGSVLFDEEFLFEVLSTDDLVINIFTCDQEITGKSLEDEIPVSSGRHVVPISRLETGVMVRALFRMIKLLRQMFMMNWNRLHNGTKCRV